MYTSCSVVGGVVGAEKMSSERVKRVIDTVTRLQEFVSRITQLDVDETEYAYLKALVLFSPGEPPLLQPRCLNVQCNLLIAIVFTGCESCGAVGSGTGDRLQAGIPSW